MAKQVAHEIKNPLTPMKLNIQQLQKAWSEDSSRLPEMFSRITALLITQIDRLSQIATEFGAFAQMPNAQPVMLDVNEALREAADLHSSPEVSVILNLSPEPLYIWMDAAHFGRVLNNLIRNSIQSVPEGRRPIIRISSEKEGDLVQMEVRDNGSGIAEDVQEKIFMPNFSTKSSGMGLGLAMVRNIIERAEGRIWFRTSIGEGTSFFITLPAHAAKDGE